MVLQLNPELEAALIDQARHRKIAPEVLAVETLRERFQNAAASSPSKDEWEQRLRGLAKNCGVSLSNSAVGSEGIYE